MIIFGRSAITTRGLLQAVERREVVREVVKVRMESCPLRSLPPGPLAVPHLVGRAVELSLVLQHHIVAIQRNGGRRLKRTEKEFSVKSREEKN